MTTLGKSCQTPCSMADSRSESSDEMNEAVTTRPLPQSLLSIDREITNYDPSVLLIENNTIQDYAQAHFGNVYSTTVQSQFAATPSEQRRLLVLGFCGGITCVWLGNWTAPYSLDLLKSAHTKVFAPAYYFLLRDFVFGGWLPDFVPTLFAIRSGKVSRVCLVRGFDATMMECYITWSIEFLHAEFVHAILGKLFEYSLALSFFSTCVMNHYLRIGGLDNQIWLPWPLTSVIESHDILRLPFQRKRSSIRRQRPSNSSMQGGYITSFVACLTICIVRIYFQIASIEAPLLSELLTFIGCLDLLYLAIVQKHMPPLQLEVFDVLQPFIVTFGEEYCCVLAFSLLAQSWQSFHDFSQSSSVLESSYRFRKRFGGDAVATACEPIWPQDFEISPLTNNATHVWYKLAFSTSRCPFLRYVLSHRKTFTGGIFESEMNLVEQRPFNPGMWEWEAIQSFIPKNATLDD